MQTPSQLKGFGLELVPFIFLKSTYLVSEFTLLFSREKETKYFGACRPLKGDETLNWVTERLNRWLKGVSWYIIRDEETKAFIGGCGMGVDMTGEHVDIGMIIKSEFSGRSISTKSAWLMADFVHKNNSVFNYKGFFATVHPDNKFSKHLEQLPHILDIPDDQIVPKRCFTGKRRYFYVSMENFELHARTALLNEILKCAQCTFTPSSPIGSGPSLDLMEYEEQSVETDDCDYEV